jgi:uncharacterized membrane protein
MLAVPMDSGFAQTLTIACLTGAGLVGGVYFVFSNFVLGGLRALSPADAMRAMQAMNEAAPNPVFGVALAGTGVGCAVLAVVAVTNWSDAAAPWALAGCALYEASLGLTFGYHVPLNHALDALDPTAPDAASRWRQHLDRWVPWNHVRAVTSLGGVVALAVALSGAP